MYNAALVRLQKFNADTDEEMHEGLMGVLPLYFLDSSGSLSLMRETMDDLSSSWAFNAPSLMDGLDNVIAKTLI